MRPSVNFPCRCKRVRQLSMRLQELTSIPVNFRADAGLSVNLPCRHEIFCHLSMRQGEFPSTFCATIGPSVNFSCNRMTLCQLAVKPSINSHPFPCHNGIFGLLFVQQRAPSVTFLYCHSTFCQLPSTFHAATEPNVDSQCSHVSFHQLTVLLLNLLSTAVTFPCFTVRQLSVRP